MPKLTDTECSTLRILLADYIQLLRQHADSIEVSQFPSTSAVLLIRRQADLARALRARLNGR